MGIYNLGGGGGAPTLEARTVTPSTSQQIIKPSRDEYDGLSQVTVEATPLEANIQRLELFDRIFSETGLGSVVYDFIKCLFTSFKNQEV